MTFTIKLKILFILGFSFVMVSAFAQDSKTTLKLADQHFALGQMEEALYYYQRVAFFERSNNNHELYGRIGDCFYESGDFDRSLEYYDRAYFACQEPDQQFEYLSAKVLTLIESDNYYPAIAELLGVDSEPGTLIDKQKNILLGTCYFGLEDFPQAGFFFAASLGEGDSIKKQQIIAEFLNEKNFTRPHPGWALALSAILPGAGQLYSGEPGAALNSFALTGGLVALVFYLSLKLTPIDSILTALPWFQRYYQGGFEKAEEFAIQERQRRRNIIYHNTIKTIIGQTQ